MAWKIRRKHCAAVVGQVSALRHPDAMVALGAMNEYDHRQFRIERLAAGVAKDRFPIYVQFHRVKPSARASRMRHARICLSNVPPSTSSPAMAVPCPPRNFVAEW